MAIPMIVEDPVSASKFDDSVPASTHGCRGCSRKIQMSSKAGRVCVARNVLIVFSTLSAAA